MKNGTEILVSELQKQNQFLQIAIQKSEERTKHFEEQNKYLQFQHDQIKRLIGKGIAEAGLLVNKQPNGLIGTPDGKPLYVSDINDLKIWKYDIQPNGMLANKTVFAPEGSDGMTIDTKGNVYLTNKIVSVFDKTGKKIAAIEVPEQPSNVCFCGKKINILFITARTSVYILKMKAKGVN